MILLIFIFALSVKSFKIHSIAFHLNALYNEKLFKILEIKMSEPNLTELMKKAQEMQKKMQWIQHELTSTEINGEAGGGLVTVILNGKHEAKKVIITDEAWKEGKQIVSDLIVAAINAAVQKVEKVAQEKMVKLTKDLGLPTGTGTDTEGGKQ